jgi:hypothetical protein
VQQAQAIRGLLDRGRDHVLALNGALVEGRPDERQRFRTGVGFHGSNGSCRF